MYPVTNQPRNIEEYLLSRKAELHRELSLVDIFLHYVRRTEKQLADYQSLLEVSEEKGNISELFRLKLTDILTDHGPLRPKHIHLHLQKSGLDIVSSYMRNLLKKELEKGNIERTARGYYQLPDWEDIETGNNINNHEALEMGHRIGSMADTTQSPTDTKEQLSGDKSLTEKR